MKLKYLIVFFLSFLIIRVANSVEFYKFNKNQINFFVNMNIANSISNFNFLNEDHSSISLGFDSKTKINKYISIFNHLEYLINLKNQKNKYDPKNIVNISYLGIALNNKVNAIAYGRQYGVMHDIAKWTEMIPALENGFLPDNFLSNQASRVISLSSNKMFGVNNVKVNLQYQLPNLEENKEDISSLRKTNGSGYGASVVYNDKKRGFSTGIAYTNHDRTQLQRDMKIVPNDNKNAESYILGIKYKNKNFYISALLHKANNSVPFGMFWEEEPFGTIVKDDIYGFAIHARTVNIYCSYLLKNNLKPMLGYTHTRIFEKSLDEEISLKEDTKDNKDNKDKLSTYSDEFIRRYIDVGIQYDVNNRISSYMNYRFNLIHNDKFVEKAHVGITNTFLVGMTYKF